MNIIFQFTEAHSTDILLQLFLQAVMTRSLLPQKGGNLFRVFYIKHLQQAQGYLAFSIPSTAYFTENQNGCVHST
jgi:hypothetical protein